VITVGPSFKVESTGWSPYESPTPKKILAWVIYFAYNIIFWEVFYGLQGVIYAHFHIPLRETPFFQQWDYYVATASIICILLCVQHKLTRVFHHTRYSVGFNFGKDCTIIHCMNYYTGYLLQLQVLDFIKALNNDFWIVALNFENDIITVMDGEALDISRMAIAKQMAMFVNLNHQKNAFADYDHYHTIHSALMCNFEQRLDVMGPRFCKKLYTVVFECADQFGDDVVYQIARRANI